LRDNVLELPIAFCLDRISVGEWGLIATGLKLYGFMVEEVEIGNRRAEAMAVLIPILTHGDYVSRAVACLPETGRDLLRRVIQGGGTSGNYFDLLDDYVAVHRESNSFWAGLRSLMRLGLAYIFHGQHKPYVVLIEGVADSSF
jgi:hypothetical protein